MEYINDIHLQLYKMGVIVINNNCANPQKSMRLQVTQVKEESRMSEVKV